MARTRKCVGAKRPVWALGTLGFVVGVVLALGGMTLQRSSDRDSSPQTTVRVAAENEMLREELRGLLDRLRVLEGQEEKLTARVRAHDLLIHVNTPGRSAVRVSGVPIELVAAALEARPVTKAGL